MNFDNTDWYGPSGIKRRASHSLSAQIRRFFLFFPITKIILMVFVILFIMSYTFSWLFNVSIDSIYIYLGLVPFLLIRGIFVWTIFTYMFIHANLIHLLSNAIVLYFIGRYVEAWLGSRDYILTFIICGLSAALLTLLAAITLPYINPRAGFLMDTLYLGASGAILGLFSVLAMDRPNTEMIFFFFLPPFIIIPYKGKAKNLLYMIALVELILGVLAFPFDIWGHFGHLGGLLSGVILYKYFLWKKIYTRQYGVEFRG